MEEKRTERMKEDNKVYKVYINNKVDERKKRIGDKEMKRGKREKKRK